MKIYEVESILKHYQYHFKTSWEQTRLISYILAQVNTKKKLKSTDIINFEWDNNSNDNITKQQMSESDIQLFRDKAKQIISKNLFQ